MPDASVALTSNSPALSHQVVVFGNTEFIQTDTHETILQALNRWMKYDSGEYYLDAEAFQGTEAAWDAVPLIFAQVHPEDFDLVDNDIEAALQTVKDYEGNPGSICGSIAETQVVIAGQPRLTSQVTLTNPKVQALYEKGKLSLSTGFTCNPGNDGHLTGTVRPNHVLVFVQTDNSQPRDKAAMFLNLKMEEDMEATHVGRVISKKNKSMFKQAIDLLTALYGKMTPGEGPDDGKDDSTACDDRTKPKTNMEGDEMADTTELKNQIEAATQTITAKDAELVNKDAEIKTLKESAEQMKNQLASIEKAQKDAAWTALKNTILPGLVDKDKDTIAGFSREAADKDPLAFANKIAEVKMKAPTGEEGKDKIPTTEKPVVNKGIGVWNATTRKYED